MINTALLPADKDPIGAAIADYFKRHKADRLRVFSSQFDEDEIPVEELFRTEKQMPLLERTALQMATGRILDVGAGSGCHSLTLHGTNTNISKKCPVILYDKNNKEIKSDEIELSDKKIRVNVNVLRAKQVPISTINKDELGKPADGYVVDDVILSSDSITVYGSEESLDSIESLDIQDDIDVSDAKGDVTQNIDVTGKLPKGLSVSGESTITVKVLIKKLITRTFEYDASEVSLNDLSSDLDVQLVTKKVKVTLQGEEEVISQLTKDDMAISADLGKVKEGTTTVHVDVAVPDNTTLMNNVTIKIKAKAK